MSDLPIFVFGSNLAGRHGKGAALHARLHRGAITGQGEGMMGTCYAIPTKGAKLEILPLWVIKHAAERFIDFARAHPEMRFQLTEIGCGLAGYKPGDIAPMFKDTPDNVIKPDAFAILVQS